MDRIDLFRVFVRVVETVSFTRAADTLGLPRSSVSMAIATLETRLGVRLLHRTTRKVVPTPDGALFYERCLRVLADFEEAETLFQQGHKKPSGSLRVDVPLRLGRLVILPALPDFFEQYPDIEMTLGMSDRTVDLVEQNIDCVLRVGPLSDSGLIAHRLGSLKLINVASPAYLARHGTPQSLDDLAAHWAVHYASPTTGRVESWEVASGQEVRHCPMRGRLTVNNAEAYIAACLAGLGLIQIPAYDVRGHLAAGELIEVLEAARAAPLPITLLYPHRRHLSQRVRVFAAWLEKLLHNTLEEAALGQED